MNLEELVKKYAGETVANKVVVKVNGLREIAAVYEEAGLVITDRGAELLRTEHAASLSNAAKEAVAADKPKRRAPRKPKTKPEPSPAAQEKHEDVGGLFDALGEDDAAGSD